MLQISEHITYAEATKSATAARLGIPNDPPPAALENMQRIARMVFEPVRRDVAKGKPLAVTSFYRSNDVNAAVGGSLTSQHSKGEAMDIDADVHGTCTNGQVFDYIRDNLEFDQLIWEFGNSVNPDWVHVSLRPVGNRRQVLRSVKRKGSTIYERM